MKKLIIALPVLFILCARSQVAVKFYSDEPTNHQNRILGIPTNIVSQVIFTNVAPAGFVLLTMDEYRTHQQTTRPSFITWRDTVYEPWAATNSQPSASVVSNRQANIEALKALVDSMEAAETNWVGLTTAQVKDVVHAHNQAFLRLRPLLRDLYHAFLAKE